MTFTRLKVTLSNNIDFPLFAEGFEPQMLVFHLVVALCVVVDFVDPPRPCRDAAIVLKIMDLGTQSWILKLISWLPLKCFLCYQPDPGRSTPVPSTHVGGQDVGSSTDSLNLRYAVKFSRGSHNSHALFVYALCICVASLSSCLY